ncbi:MAG: hypothetical protein HBSAPP03_00110 [Phycisphaerae bacterium]|nr:MAG: hypothetical protein HBSAPP03_00110 [Phycisphaerae bacterium]
MSRLMSAMDLPFFPILALALFMLAFAAILWGVHRAGRAAENHARIPLEDGSDQSTSMNAEGRTHG